MATINGTFNSLIAGTLSGTVATPGAPGVGVPAGGLTGQVLTKATNGSYETVWATFSPGATESWVTTNFLSKAGNLSGLTNLATARDNLQLGLLYSPTFAGLTLQGSGANVGQYTPTSLTLSHTTFGQFTIQPSSGITFPDTTVQTTAFPAGSDMPTGGLTGQALVKQSNSNYDADWATLSPDYITSVASPLTVTAGELSIDLSGYATESWVTSQGYLTSANLIGYATEEWVNSQGFLTSTAGLALLSGADFTGRVTVPSAILDGEFSVPGFNIVPTQNEVFNMVDGDLWIYDDEGLTPSKLRVCLENNTQNVATESWVTAGVTFTGKTNFTSVGGAAGLNIGIGGTTLSTVAGDIWIPTAGTNLNFRDGNGIARVCASTTSGNTFNQPQNIDTSNTLPALRVTQRGSGNALLVEDSTTPDTSALVVDAAGNVGVGVATGYTSTSKLEVVGNVKGTTLSTDSGPVFSVNSITSHTGGSDTNDLLVTIGGVNYRIGLRPA